MSNTVRDTLEDYFSSMNPISNRMMADIIESKQKYQSEWDNLTYDEQSDRLWNSIVKIDVEQRYQKAAAQKYEVKDYFPILRIHPGEKIVMDDDSKSACSFGSTWRDEHSAPFRWETESQLDLRITPDNKTKDSTKQVSKQTPTTKQPTKTTQSSNPNVEKTASTPESAEMCRLALKQSSNPKVEKTASTPESAEMRRPVLRGAKRPEVPPPPIPPHAILGSKTLPNPSKTHMISIIDMNAEISADTSSIRKHDDMPIYAKVVKRKSASAKTLVMSEMKARLKEKEDTKPAVPPRMSLDLRGDLILSKFKTMPIDIDDIPKTGFDFLDNW